MGQGQNWKCTNCDYEVCISGFWGFYRDNKGNLKGYSDPVPEPTVDEKVGSGGTYVEWYCPKCKEIQLGILIEFGEVKIMPYHKIRRIDSDSILFFPTCDKCGTELKNTLDETDICPKCNKGIFKKGGRWYS